MRKSLSNYLMAAMMLLGMSFTVVSCGDLIEAFRDNPAPAPAPAPTPDPEPTPDPTPAPDPFVEPDPDPQWTLIAEKDWTGVTSEELSWWQFAGDDESGYNGSVAGTADGIAVTVTEDVGQIWQPQGIVLEGFNLNLEKKRDFLVRIIAKIPVDGQLQVNMGSWEGYEQYEISVKGKDGWQVIDVPFKEFGLYGGLGEDAHVLFQCGNIVGTSIVKKVQVFDMGNTYIYPIADIDWTQEAKYYEGVWYTDIDNPDGCCNVSVTEDGLVIESNPEENADYWNPQIPMIAHLPDITEGESYKVSFQLTAPADGEIRLDFCSWDDSGATYSKIINVEIGTNRYFVDFEDYPTTCTDAMIFYQCGKMPGTHIIRDVEIYKFPE